MRREYIAANRISAEAARARLPLREIANMDRFAKICLLLIVLLLSVVALRPILTPAPVHASPRYTEYDAKVIDQMRVDSLSKALSQASVDGWEVVGVTSMPDFHPGTNALLVLLAR